jgi:hypothetical protein
VGVGVARGVGCCLVRCCMIGARVVGGTWGCRGICGLRSTGHLAWRVVRISNKCLRFVLFVLLVWGSRLCSGFVLAFGKDHTLRGCV